jgi:hypothetical protein
MKYNFFKKKIIKIQKLIYNNFLLKFLNNFNNNSIIKFLRNKFKIKNERYNNQKQLLKKMKEI